MQNLEIVKLNSFTTTTTCNVAEMIITYNLLILKNMMSIA